jgi:hypothetical protein
MEGTVIMDYQLTITFAELGHHTCLPDRLLAILLERLAGAGPVLAHNQVTGTLTVMFAFTSSDPIDDVSRLSRNLGVAMSDAGLMESPTIVDVHLAVARASDEDPTGLPGALSLA